MMSSVINSQKTSGDAIVAEGLRKRFGQTIALDGLDLRVEKGSVVGILGPNGAGKTTAVRILCTLLIADGGRALVAGHDVAREPGLVRESISLTGQFAAVDERLTGEENLVLLGRLQGLSASAARGRARTLLEQFRLHDAARRLAGTYSGGMRRRLDLAASLMVARPIVFLDEPTTGLDPRSRLELWDAIEQLAREGTTIVLTTQYLEEADRLCDTIVVIDSGRAIAQGTPVELRRQTGGTQLAVTVRDVDQLQAARVAFAREYADSAVHVDGRELTIAVSGEPLDVLARATDALRVGAVTIDELALRHPTLDDAFLALTGQPITSTPQTARTVPVAHAQASDGLCH
jgi:daunorubicin resistance ABC transporter ATP-binding subunit